MALESEGSEFSLLRTEPSKSENRNVRIASLVTVHVTFSIRCELTHELNLPSLDIMLIYTSNEVERFAHINTDSAPCAARKPNRERDHGSDTSSAHRYLRSELGLRRLL